MHHTSAMRGLFRFRPSSHALPALLHPASSLGWATATAHNNNTNNTHVRNVEKSRKRNFSSYNNNNSKPRIVLQKRGDFPYGSREYLLVVNDGTETDDERRIPEDSKIASLRAHRNIIFGARLFGKAAENRRISEVCLPLLDKALEDASVEGEQPQAMATLHGLCQWVTQCIEEEESNNTEMPNSQEIHKMKMESKDDLRSYYAVRAIATGIPREGHSIVGQGTFHDGEEGWESLAKEFIKLKLADEVELYQARGGMVATIEHLADTNPEYLRSAGGAMARLFFM